MAQRPRVFLRPSMRLLKPEPRNKCDASRRGRRGYLPERKRIYHRIDARKLNDIENVGSLNMQFQRPGFLHRNGFAQRHVQADLARSLDNVAPSIAEGTSIGIRASAGGCGSQVPRGNGRAESRSVEPLRGGRVAQGDSRTSYICAQRSTHPATDVQRIAE